MDIRGLGGEAWSHDRTDSTKPGDPRLEGVADAKSDVALVRRLDRETGLEAARRINEFQRYFIEIIEQKRANPTEDVISDLVHATLAEEGDPRTMDYSELLSCTKCR